MGAKRSTIAQRKTWLHALWRCSSQSLVLAVLFFFPLFSSMNEVRAENTHGTSEVQHVIIPILGTTLNEYWETVGIVAEIQVEFSKRKDHDGLSVRFGKTPGRFSSLAQRSVTEAIVLVADAAHLKTDSWNVRFTLPYSGVTLYGESLSAMAALSVVALAKNDPRQSDTVITGTVTSDGHIGMVGGVPLKIVAAYEEHFRRVVIPEEQDVADGDWQTPFLMHISPIASVSKAYVALTDRPLSTPSPEPQLSANLVQ
jgi:hypothetical protein